MVCGLGLESCVLALPWQHEEVKQLNDIALLNMSSRSYGASLAIRAHTVLPATQYK